MDDSGKQIYGIPDQKQTDLSDEQLAVIDAVVSKQNIFLTGSAGVGKSFVLKEVIKILPPSSTYITASTGVAACNINGITFHSFAGIGLGNAPFDILLKRAMRRFSRQRWMNCRALVVDEISMISGELFETVEKIARAVRRNPQPFGGIQLILCGDFLQLPPVDKSGRETKFCFEVPAWDRCIQRTILLKKVFRQREEKFIGILNRVRIGDLCKKDKAELLKCHYNFRTLPEDGIQATKLYPHRISCERVNVEALARLPGETEVYYAKDVGSFEYLEQMDKFSKFSKVLSLKVGAQVMLLKNLDVAGGLVNGSRGIVTGFFTEDEHRQLLEGKTDEEIPSTEEEDGKKDKKYPYIRFTNGIERFIQDEKASIEMAGREVASRQQLPLALAWAVSIHKAQGVTLDRVELSLHNVFEYGQAYVALSRSTSLAGLRLDDFTSDRVKAHPRVLKYYRRLEEALDSKTSSPLELDASTSSEVTPFKDIHSISCEDTPFKHVHDINTNYEFCRVGSSTSQHSFHTGDAISNKSEIASPKELGFKSPQRRRNSRLSRASRRQAKETANKMPNQSKINLKAFFGGSMKRKHQVTSFMGEALANGTKLFRSSNEEGKALPKPSSSLKSSNSQHKVTSYFNPTAKVVDQSSPEQFVHEDVASID